MPFEVDGKLPSFGSTSDAFKPLASTTPLQATSPPTFTFGATAVIGTKPTFGDRSSFASKSSPWAQPVPSTPTLAHPVSSQRLPSSNLEKGTAPNTPLVKALKRVGARRPAVFGLADIAADRLFKQFLDGQQAGDDVPENALFAQLSKAAAEYPDVAKLLNFTFEQAAIAKAQLPFGGDGKDEDVTFADEMESLDSRGDGEIQYDSPLDNALWDVVQKKCEALDWTLDGDTSRLAVRVYHKLLRGCTKVTLRTFIRKQAECPGQTTISEFVDWAFETIAGLRRTHSNKKDSTKVGMRWTNPLTVAESSMFDPDRVRTSVCTCTMSLTEPQVERDPVTAEPFRFLDLPAELRNRVYRLCLVPTGFLSLQSCAHQVPLGTYPALTLGILSTNKQIAEEAKDIIFENTVVANMILFAHTKPIVHRSQMPWHVLSSLTKLTLIVEGHNTDVDWTPLQALTSLKVLRVATIQDGDSDKTDALVPLLERIIPRVPRDCIMDYGCRPGEETKHIRDKINRIAADANRAHSDKYRETDTSVLKAAAEKLGEEIEPGSKSGELPSQSTSGPWKELWRSRAK